MAKDSKPTSSNSSNDSCDQNDRTDSRATTTKPSGLDRRALRMLTNALEEERSDAFRRRWNFDLEDGPVAGPWMWEVME